MGLKSMFNKPSSSSDPPSRSTSLSVRSRTRLAGELEEVFKKFDVNGDGKISASELGSIMGSLGQPTSEQELNNMIREVDGDGDGCISLQEFIELNTKGVDSDEILENLKDAFAVFDMDGNGSITAEELNTVMRSLGEECSLAECWKMIGVMFATAMEFFFLRNCFLLVEMCSINVSDNDDGECCVASWFPNLGLGFVLAHSCSLLHS
jgi:calcium-binding protein CML